MTYPNYKNKHLEDALFHPNDYVKYRKFLKNKKKFPEKYILIYSKDLMKSIITRYKPKFIGNLFVGTEFYWWNDIGIIKLQGIGSPHAATVFEEVIGIGGKYFLNIGTAGGLQKEGFYLCKKSLRDEGTSYHYIKKGEYAYPDKTLTKALGKSMTKTGIKYEEASSWTIDAPYRETRAEIAHYKKQGIATVEMEASALFAVAKVRNVKIASAFVVSDVLGEKWKPKFHHISTKKGLDKIFDAAIDCLSNYKK